MKFLKILRFPINYINYKGTLLNVYSMYIERLFNVLSLQIERRFNKLLIKKIQNYLNIFIYIRKKELRKKRNRKTERKNQRKIERQSKDKNIYSHPPPFILYYTCSIFNSITKY